jgi:hypothetical protein
LTIVNNTIVSGRHGILLNSAGTSNNSFNTIANNTITATGANDNGIYLLSTSTTRTMLNNTIYNNTIKANGSQGYGIFITSSGITKNTINGTNISLNIINASGALAVGINITDNGTDTITNNTIWANATAPGVCLYIAPASNADSIYWNNFTSGYNFINITNATNNFNTTVGGVAEGNFYQNWSNSYYGWTSSIGGNWADGGTHYPANVTNTPGIFVGTQGTDNGPWIQAVGGSAAFYGPIFAGIGMTTAPTWGQYVSGTSITWCGGPINASRQLGVFTTGAGILVINQTNQYSVPIWKPE